MKLRILRKMGLFKKRDKRKGASKSASGADLAYQTYGASSSNGYHPRFGRMPPPPASGRPARGLTALPDRVLERIFALVCPHSRDTSYEKCEDSSIEDACMLCDTRDLAHCVKVCRRWRAPATRVLYHSIRIDAVHYCEREAYLAEHRKSHSWFDKNGEPEDPAEVRLKLLCKTLREDPVRLGRLVEYLKTPYMLRESRQADLARTIAVLPRLRYVDLPEGLFMDDPAYTTLKLEVQARCHDLRKMTYIHGAERSLKALAEGHIWRNLEVLELIRINLEPNMLRHVLATLRNLRALKVDEAKNGPHCFTDDIIVYTEHQFPEIPPLEELILMNVAAVSAEGLQDYLTRPEERPMIKSLTLNGTGVKPWQLQEILSSAPALHHLTLVDAVKSTLPAAAGTRDILPLASTSLQTLNYEITGDASVGAYSGVTSSYYNYLSGSLMSGGLPSLRAIYVRDANFPESLAGGLPPPLPSFADGVFPRRPSSSHSQKAAGAFGQNNGYGPSMSPKGAFLTPNHSPGYPQQQHQMPPLQQHPQYNQPAPLQPQNTNPFLSSDPSKPPSVRRRPSKPPVPTPWAATGHNPRFSTNNPFAALISPQTVQTLEVFTKGDDDIDWSSVKVSPEDSLLQGFGGLGFGGAGAGGGGRGSVSAARPSSSYGLADHHAGAGARKSVFMSAGGGQFLAVPDAVPGPAKQVGGIGGDGNGRVGRGGWRESHADGEDEWPRPKSSTGKKSERMDLWR